MISIVSDVVHGKRTVKTNGFIVSFGGVNVANVDRIGRAHGRAHIICAYIFA